VRIEGFIVIFLHCIWRNHRTLSKITMHCSCCRRLGYQSRYSLCSWPHEGTSAKGWVFLLMFHTVAQFCSKSVCRILSCTYLAKVLTLPTIYRTWLL